MLRIRNRKTGEYVKDWFDYTVSPYGKVFGFREPEDSYDEEMCCYEEEDLEVVAIVDGIVIGVVGE